MVHSGARGPGDMRKAEGVNERDRVVSAAWTVGDTRRDGIELGLTWPEEGDRKTHGEHLTAYLISARRDQKKT